MNARVSLFEDIVDLKRETRKTALLGMAVLIACPMGRAVAEPHLLDVQALYLTGTMSLSNIQKNVFDDVSSASGAAFSYLYQGTGYFRIGGGFFVVNGKSKDTAVSQAGGGLIMELFHDGRLQPAGGIQLGGANVTATVDSAPTSHDRIDQGFHYRGGGFLAAPYVKLGFISGKNTAYAMYKHVFFGPGSDDIDAYNGGYVVVGGTFAP